MRELKACENGRSAKKQKKYLQKYQISSKGIVKTRKGKK